MVAIPTITKKIGPKKQNGGNQLFTVTHLHRSGNNYMFFLFRNRTKVKEKKNLVSDLCGKYMLDILT